MQRNGTLKIPQHASFRYGMVDNTDDIFAFEYVVTRDALIFKSPIINSKLEADVNHIKATEPSKVLQSPSALETFAISDYSAVIHEEEVSGVSVLGKIKKDQKILARVHPNYPGVLEIQTFKTKSSKNSNMPESGRAIEADITGYVLIDSAKKDEEINEQFVQEDKATELFPNENLINDVCQNKFGDCFLLATLLSILNTPNGAEIIKGMMVNKGDNTIVRLYDPTSEPLEPFYIKIKNSKYTRQNEPEILHSGLWVHILEKAYTAAGFRSNPMKDTKGKIQVIGDLPAFRVMYGDGGDPAVALSILTGKKAEKVFLKNTESVLPVDHLNFFLGRYMAYQPLLKAFPKMEKFEKYLFEKRDDVELKYLQLLMDLLATPNDEVFLQKLDSIKNNFKEPRSPLFQAILEKFPEIIKIQSKLEVERLVISSFREIMENALTISNIQEREEFFDRISRFITDKYTLLTPKAALAGYLNTLREYIILGEMVAQNPEFDLPELLLTPKDHTQALELLSNLRDQGLKISPEALAILQRFLYEPYVNDESTKTPVKPRFDVGLGSGCYSENSLNVYNDIKTRLMEGKSVTATTKEKFEQPGLRNNHVYSVVGVAEFANIEDAASNYRIKGTKFIKLRNPWGNTGQILNWDKEKHAFVPKEDSSGEFYLELSEFNKFFGSYSYGDVPKQKSRAEAEVKEELILRENQTLLHRPPSPASAGGSSESLTLQVAPVDPASLRVAQVPPPILPNRRLERRFIDRFSDFTERNQSSIRSWIAGGILAGACGGAITGGFLGLPLGPFALITIGVGAVAGGLLGGIAVGVTLVTIGVIDAIKNKNKLVDTEDAAAQKPLLRQGLNIQQRVTSPVDLREVEQALENLRTFIDTGTSATQNVKQESQRSGTPPGLLPRHSILRGKTTEPPQEGTGESLDDSHQGTNRGPQDHTNNKGPGQTTSHK